MRLSDHGRAAHPKIRSSSLRHYLLDESVPGAAVDLARGASASGATMPAVVPGCTPRARRFFSTRTDALAESAAVAELVAALREDCTFGILFRVHTAPVGACCLFAHSGTGNDVSATTNFLASLFLLAGGQLRAFHENDTTGDNVATNFSGAVVTPFDWTYAVVRKRDVTGDGPGGTCTLDLLINGVGTDTVTGVENCSHGSAGVLRIGHEVSGAGAVASNGDVDIAGVYVWGEALADSDIADDARRIRSLPFYTRQDVAVRVTDLAGAEIDLTDVAGVDFVDSFQVDDDIDNATITARVSLLREEAALSVAGLVTDARPNLDDVLDPASYTRPLLAEGASIEILAARVPLGLRARPSELSSIFRGHIDEIAEGGEASVLQCRDEGGLLIDTYIEEEVAYSDIDTPFAVEGEMQYILDDNDNDAGNNSVAGLTARTGSYDPITLDVPVSPSWSVLGWRQRREPVLSALRTLAGQIGWECRYRFRPDPFAPGWRLSFYEPDRSRVSCDAVLAPDDIIDVTDLTRSIYGQRNVVRIIYPSAETTLPALPALPSGISGRSGWSNLDGDDNRVVAFVELQHDDSIAALGRRLFMEIVEEGASQISSIVEATAMALGALLDLADPGLAKGITLPSLWEADLNDQIRFQANPRLFTAPQTLAVRSLSHTFDEVATSTVQLRGHPAVGFRRWLRLEARPGNGRPGIMDPRDALTDVPAGTLLQAYRNLLDRSSYFRGGKFVQVRNPDFSSFSAGKANPPDGWSMKAGVWGTDVDVVEGVTLSGTKAIILNTDTGELISSPVAITGDPNVPFSAEMRWQRELTSAEVPVMQVQWLSASHAVISTVTLKPGAAPPPAVPQFGAVPSTKEVWFTSRADGLQPPDNGGTPPNESDVRFVRLILRTETGASETAFLIDDVAFYRTSRELVVHASTQYNPPLAGTPSWVPVRFSVPLPPWVDSRVYDLGFQCFESGGAPNNASSITATAESIGTGFGSGWYSREDQTVTVHAVATVGSSEPTDQRVTALRLVKNATYGANYQNTGGTVLFTGQHAIMVPGTSLNNAGITTDQAAQMTLSARVALLRGDRLTVEYLRNETDTKAIGNVAPGDLNQLSIKQDIAQ